jgi:invasion protein IalB
MRQAGMAALVALAGAGAAPAQDRQGNDTAGDWVVTHTAHFGLWDSVCDERPEGAAMHRRCYIRYVDVFSDRPKFAAHFVFVTPEGAGLRIEYGSEPGTRFVPGGHRIEAAGETVWQAERASCLQGGSCVFERDAAAALYALMKAGGEWRFDFADRHGQIQSLGWDLEPFAGAAADFEREAAARGLR